MFKIIAFYKDDKCLEKYFQKWQIIGLLENPKKTKYCTVYNTEMIQIECYKCTQIDNMHGYRAHIIAVQEELTWGDDWENIQRAILDPMRASPIPIQVFDGLYPPEHGVGITE